jgi:Mg/Co/Ni transporter MgtE
VLATGRPVDGRVDGVMSSPVVTISADADVHEAYVLFGKHAGRRLAVVRAGEFVGMVTLDDLLVDLAAELSELVRPVTGEILFGHRDHPYPQSVTADVVRCASGIGTEVLALLATLPA